MQVERLSGARLKLVKAYGEIPRFYSEKDVAAAGGISVAQVREKVAEGHLEPLGAIWAPDMRFIFLKSALRDVSRPAGLVPGQPVT
jgi:hypothetical protein